MKSNTITTVETWNKQRTTNKQRAKKENINTASSERASQVVGMVARRERERERERETERERARERERETERERERERERETERERERWGE